MPVSANDPRRVQGHENDEDEDSFPAQLEASAGMDRDAYVERVGAVLSMATDREVVQSAYEHLVATLFATFFSSYNSAMSDPAAETEAEQRFKMGVVHARHVRDRALSLLP